MEYFRIIFSFILTLLLFINGVSSEEIVLNNFVNDHANIIDEDFEHTISLVLKEIYDSNAAEFSIVTINSLEGQDIESYSMKIAQGNLGDEEKNNGLLLLISLEDKKYRFEVGRGLESILNDAKVGRIGRTYLVPNFKNGNYGEGILSASNSIKSILLGDNTSEYFIGESENPNFEKLYFLFILSIIILIFVFIAVIASKKKSVKYKDKYFNAATSAIILFGGRNRGKGGGNFGGFGGFSGGSFGGGGASGRW